MLLSANILVHINDIRRTLEFSVTYIPEVSFSDCSCAKLIELNCIMIMKLSYG